MAKGRLRNLLKKIFNRENVRKPVFWIGVIGVAGVIFAFVAGGLYITEQPFFCQSCHIMKGPADAWKKSTHAKVRCTLCHVKPGFVEMIKHKPLGLLEVWAVVTRHPVKPAEVHLPENENCEVCHKAERKVSPSGDIKIPHKAHTQLRGLRCADCHRWLVHRVNPAKHNRPSMVVCYKCHNGKKAPNSCTTCHTEKAIPDTHKAADWLKVHRQTHDANPGMCETCHGWVKDYCSECHQRRPKSHKVMWRTNHQYRIAVEGKGGCIQCHKDTACVRCHGRVP